MKNEFWAYRSLLIGATIYMILAFSLFVTFLILTITINFNWLGVLISSILLLCCVLWLFLDKNILLKVQFSNLGILCTKLKKQIVFIKWDDIQEITNTPRAWNSSLLTLKSNSQRIDIELNQKIYNTIMNICPIPNLKVMINEIECFGWFHRKK